ncbi:hypothetical protein BXP70_25105 [Hymenobacter crusticola]|uniref:Glycosyltransferase RgtA/B/C/D-like domain-containing protein n=1 Tax=Hymenobacter crusticola TaxID=1770526 RepID=A0A243W6R1_9BACT|nr:hypothetical protein BXP70_25105 [Hymenobacter crusticola]
MFFGLLLALGLLVYRDYGVSTDEVVHHLNGMVNVKYIGQRLAPELARHQASYASIPDLNGYVDNDHGVLFEAPVAVLSLLLTHHDSRSYYFMRHLLIFLTFVGGTWALFQLGRLCFQDWRWALLGPLLLIASPRFFAEAFYNGMDIVFMAAFTLAMYTLVRMAQQPSFGRVILHGLASAAAIDVRIVGLLTIGFTLGIVGLVLVQRTSSQLTAPRLAPTAYTRAILLYLAFTLLFMVLGWPYLWEDPLGNFSMALARMSRFPWMGRNFYFGQYLRGSEVPWHYVPVWIFITTPLPYTIAAIVGVFSCGLAFLRGKSRFIDLLLIGWVLVPLALIIALHSSVYNGWRHLYFIYPALLLLAVHGIRTLRYLAVHRRAWRPVVLTIALTAGLEVGRTIVRMIQMHPHQQVYFSVLPTRVAEAWFDRDYWGLSYRAGLEWILAHDSTPLLVVTSPRPDLIYNNSLILPAAQRQRLRIVYPDQKHQYLLIHYAPQDSSLGRKIHTLYAGDLPILTIFRR